MQLILNSILFSVNKVNFIICPRTFSLSPGDDTLSQSFTGNLMEKLEIEKNRLVYQILFRFFLIRMLGGESLPGQENPVERVGGRYRPGAADP